MSTKCHQEVKMKCAGQHEQEATYHVMVALEDIGNVPTDTYVCDACCARVSQDIVILDVVPLNPEWYCEIHMNQPLWRQCGGCIKCKNGTAGCRVCGGPSILIKGGY